MRIISCLLILSLLCSCGTSARLRSDANPNDEDETINIGYGKISKKHSAVAVSSMKVENTTYTDIYELIKNRVPGVIVNGNSITMRGEKSINASNETLIVVDGIVMEDISHISPDLVDTIEVLRDAASASIYGSRSANGVILITLKI